MEAEETVGVKARTVLWYLTFVGFAMNYMIRINVNIAIVDMISNEFKGRKVDMSECFSVTNATNFTAYTVHETAVSVVEEEKFLSLERRLLDFIGVRYCDLSANFD
jgi:sugar phosphate permease